MKKFIVILAIAFSSFAASAAEVKVSTAVLNAFNNDFAGASEVNWSSGNAYYKASFVHNAQHLTVYYSFEGTMLAMTRNISSLDMPMSLQASLKKDYAGRWISELFELSNEEGTSYYITLEQADSKIILKSVNGSEWSMYKKVTKA